jgi:thioesterase domain-containing protein
MGGPIALEMGKGILAAGEEIGFLALVDPRVRIDRGPRYYTRRLVSLARQGELSPVLRQRARRLVKRGRTGVDPLHTAEETFVGSLARARDAYRPTPLDTCAVILVSNDYDRPHEYWRRLMRGGVSWQKVGGRHQHLFLPPAVDRLAEALGSELRQAQDRAGDGR